MVEVRISLEPWLAAVLSIMLEMARIGYFITEEDIGRLVKGAVIIEVE